MRAVTIYDRSTGEIKKTIFVPSGHEISLSDGEAMLDGQYDDEKFSIIDGEPCAKPALEGASSIDAVDDAGSESGEYPAPTINDLRQIRGQMLAASDWTQLPDAPVDQAAWAVYRQELRDLPANTEDPSEVVWPKPPTS